MVNIFRRKKSDKNEGDEASAAASSEQVTDKGGSKRNPPKKGSDQTRGNPETITLRVKIPPNVKPGDTFAVYGK